MFRKKRDVGERRRAPRRDVHWLGQYRLGTSRVEERRPCVVVNVSRVGAALVLYEGTTVRVGDALVIDVERLGETVVLMPLSGTVRRVMPAVDVDPASPRVGVDLAFDTPTAQQISRMLFGADAPAR